MSFNLVNFIFFQAGWFSICFSAASGRPWLGIGIIAVWFLLHLFFVPYGRLVDLALAVIAATLGYIVDSILVLTGFIDFPEMNKLGAPSTLWMVALWFGFALTLRHCLSWLRERKTLAIIFALLGGPLAYFAGMRFGALIFPSEPTMTLAMIGIVWAVSMPILLVIVDRLEKSMLPSWLLSRGTVQ